MYTTTFYSFKGGVGRTMALVNVAVHLVNLGRKVLLVDFDLEAPGLETFPALRPPRQTPGVVDFVSRYLATGEAPAVPEFLFQVNLSGTVAGQLSVMPAGTRDGRYGKRLNAINWEELYSEREGFLLFEDLKAQWRGVVKPDYVLIDSRTGHTDIGGICTRQLPDAVVVLFFPNEQNLQGLQAVVEDIRREALGPRKKEVRLHFVTGNIPELDDEDQILETSLGRFSKALGYDHLDATIHHYDSLSLLNQVVFAAERPRSRLAHEYQLLAREIIRQNTEDRDGVVAYLKGATTSPSTLFEAARHDEFDEKLAAIHRLYARDAEILESLAQVRREQGLLDEALECLDAAIDSKGPSPKALLERAEVNRQLERRPEAIADVRAALATEGLPFSTLWRSLRFLRYLDPSILASVPNLSTLASLDEHEKLALASEFFWHRKSLPRVRELLAPLLKDQRLNENLIDGALTAVSLSLIGAGKFAEAKRILGIGRGELLVSKPIHHVFNYAMAEWALSGRPKKDIFVRIVELGKARPPEKRTANFLQCMAICHRVLRNPEDAKKALRQSRQKLLARPTAEFSAWRYLQLTPAEFLGDLDAMSRWIDGRRILPGFMREAARARRINTKHKRPKRD